MELLAPAGSREAFAAAVEGGADALYLGIGNFNARRRAKNFTARDLAYMTSYAHRRGKKVYVALNILIKEKELEAMARTVYEAVSCGADAFIVQDLGVYSFLRKHFPKIPIHASTQMTVHNVPGVRQLEKMGFDRVILSRELTLEEIAAISSKTALDLEVFVHGALCFSISGLCFASSVMGGFSGNRGACTQPCRREWEHRGIEQYFFSPLDLDASAYLEKLRKLKIRSLKIEGRMKNPDYVYQVVGRWRKLIDGEITADTPFEDYGRRKTAYYLSGLTGAVLHSSGKGTVGLYAGKTLQAEKGKAAILLEQPLASGDSVRWTPPGREESSLFTVRHMEVEGRPADSAPPGVRIELLSDKIGGPGDFYIAARGEAAFRAAGEKPGGLCGGKKKPPLKLVRADWRHHVRKPVQKKCLTVIKIPDGEFLPWIRSANADLIVLPMGEASGLLRKGEAEKLKDRLVLWLEPFIPQSEIDGRAKEIKKLHGEGFTRWMANNPGHLDLLPGGSRIYGGPFLYALNRLAEKELEKLGVTATMVSMEDDFLNIRARMPANAFYPLFFHPPLFFTRITAPHFLAHGSRFSHNGVNAKVFRRGEIAEIVSEKPVSLFQMQSKLHALGAAGFYIDFTWCPRDGAYVNSAVAAYRNRSALEGTFKYNFKRELK